MDARHRIAAGYANSDTERNRQAANEAAGKAWRWDATAERLLVLMDAGHPVTPLQRSAAGYYIAGKDAAKAAGIDTGGPS